MQLTKLEGVLRWKRPGAEYLIRGTDPSMSDVEWLDAVQVKPTQLEIDGWSADYDAQGIASQEAVNAVIDGEKVTKAIVVWANQRANDAALQWNTFRDIVAAAASLADIKTGVANQTADLTETTPAQAKAAILAIYRTL